ncbi:hypothetical protein FRB99_002883, partial [Tulasnella sp. 403]
MTASFVTVSTPPGGVVDSTAARPAHHLNDCKSLFTNPWPSYRRPQALSAMLKFFVASNPPVPHEIDDLLKKQKPTFGVQSTDPKAMKATWLGHACFLLELPAPQGATREPPCSMEELPEIDVVVISHNHYDHLDTESIQTLERLHKPHIFAPLGNDAYFHSLGIPKERTHILDWWESRHVAVGLSQEGAAGGEIKANFAVTCTPAQHFSARGITDRFKTLWASWAVEELPEYRADIQSGQGTGMKAWFGGDTGYRSVFDGENEDDVPVCPGFKEIGKKFGSFDLAFIPIGAFEPRAAMSPVHCAPQDSVHVFKDINAKRAVGMH